MNSTRSLIIFLGFLISFVRPLLAGEISFSEALSDDASTGINTSIIYTHAVSGGSATTVNGVDFELLDGVTDPSDFSWEVSSVKNQLQNNNGGWDPFAAGVTEEGLQSLLGSFTFNNNGEPGSNQTFILSGLTPGEEYEARLYCRKWSDDTERTQEVTFTAGAEDGVTEMFAEDRPENDPIGALDRESAYYIAYTYTADAEGALSIRFDVTGAAATGSFHMYGLTNQVIGDPVFVISADAREFSYSVEDNGVISELIGSYDGEVEPTEFTLVEGEGDDDNDLFRIVGDELRAGRFDFSSADDGTKYYVRIQGRGAESGESGETMLVFTLIGEKEPSPFTFVGPLTDDESSGIDPENEYSHAISGGGAETVNGVDFELLNSNTTPNNFSWEVSSIKNQLDNNNGGWDVGSSGVTGSGLLDLLGSFTFNNDGAVGSNQTFTLSGLDPGGTYEARLYMRKWDNSTQRQQLVEFTAGDKTDSITFSEDHPELDPIDMEFRDQASYMSYTYTAGADGDLSIKFTITDDGIQGASGSFHMYGLTNQIVQASADDDNDGLPDSWEEKYGVDDPEADDDNDGLTNADEFEERTQPNKADTDGDGLNDGAEIADTKTNPLKADSDNDGLDDGVETNTGVFVSSNNTGTDPNNRDTDGDNFSDGYEIDAGSNPNDAEDLPLLPGGFSIALLTDDESSGIDAVNEYTHAISGGGAENVNGVEFELLNSGTTPDNFDWEVSSVKNQIDNNNGGWNVGASGVTGEGLQALLGSFTFNNNGSPGSNQTFTLSGLTPGQTYETRLYTRKWDNSTARTQELTFTAGDQDSNSIIFSEDHPELPPLSLPDREVGWYLGYTYTADGSGSLSIRCDVLASPEGVQGDPGSYHMYGLTNQVSSAPVALQITEVIYDPEAPQVAITFNSRPGATYAVDFSTNLQSSEDDGGWAELDDGVISEGKQTTYVDDFFVGNEKTIFYRVRQIE
ncbi:thrombospondin type 3 repeat-containing protein [Verrucomicrobia bacterium]|nr:thrombospondin type 3 repeat-containing protein [Verrucomicrobiota bacterium]